MSDPHVGGPVPHPHRKSSTHLDNTFSCHGYVTSTPMLDGHLLARPLVLDVEGQPATPRASTLMSRPTKPSVMRPNERCPPAAIPRSSTLLQRSWGQRGALVPLQAPDLSSSRIQSPPHSRPRAKGLRPKIVIMPHTSRGQTSDGGLSPPSRRPPSLGNDHFRPHVVGGGTQGTRGGVVVGPARAGQYRPVGCVRPDLHHPQPDPRNGV